MTGANDYYALLEVGPDADADQLKRAYRRLAQVHHPDANPDDPAAADRFREIAQAYAVLSNAVLRIDYDAAKNNYRSRTPDAPDFPSVEELIEASGAILGRHIVTPITVPLDHVATGATVAIEVEGVGTINVDIPPGVDEADIVRIEGKGQIEDDIQGDVILIIHVPRHEYFTRDGDDFSVAREVNVSDLALGTTLTIPTFHGPTALDIPAGTRPGEVFEIAGYGIRHADGRSGALHVRIEASSGGLARTQVDKGSFSGLMDVLDDDDVEVIPTLGSLFDSDVHEVVGEVEPGPGVLVVTGEVRRGYRVRGQVIRPALVTVTSQGHAMNRDWLEKDFYKTLEVSKDASDDDIKKSYRKLAQKLHPDANPGDDAASERFKEVSEAYSVLSDAERRKEYDQVRSLGPGAFGGNPFGGAGGQNVRIEDLFGGGLGDLFGFGGNASRRGGPQRGSDVGAVLNLSFEDSIRGATTDVSVDGDVACSRCRGNGAEPGTSIDVCGTCGGTGSVASNQGFFSFTNPCPTCRGSGRHVPSPCTKCRGRGTERRTRTIKVRIPAGVKDGGTIRLRGKGSPGLRGGPAGDLLVKLRVARHPVFKRSGDDLTIRLPLSFTEAALGAKVDVPTLNGPVTLKIPSGTPSGKTFRVRKEGVQRERGRPGDLLVTVEVAVPEKLPKQAKKMLEEFRDLYEDEDPRSNLAV